MPGRLTFLARHRAAVRRETHAGTILPYDVSPLGEGRSKMSQLLSRASFSLHRLRRGSRIVAAATILATLALAAGIVFDESRLTGREQRLVRAAGECGRDLARFLAAEVETVGCSRLAEAASEQPFGLRARRALEASPTIGFIHVLNTRGEIVWSSKEKTLSSNWLGDPPEEASAESEPGGQAGDEYADRETDIFVEMVSAVGAKPRCGAVVLGLSERKLAAALRLETPRTLTALAGFGLAVLLAVTAVSRALARRQNEAIRRKSQAEHLAELGLLAAGLTHELRNSLNAIHFATNSLAHRAGKVEPNELSEEMVEITREIGDEVSTLDRLVGSFLSYARPSPDLPEDVDLVAVVRSALAIAEPELARCRGEVRVELPAQPVIVHSLPGPLRQVVVNLVQNAAQACGPANTILVRVTERADSVLFEVSDDGPGVPDKVRSSLFQPFVTGRREGTGLGLAITRRLVASMEGTVRFEEVLPHGSRFSVELPRRLSI